MFRGSKCELQIRDLIWLYTWRHTTAAFATSESEAEPSLPKAVLTTPFISAADIISAVEFDETGQHLATGDRGGRVVLFERLSSPQVPIG